MARKRSQVSLEGDFAEVTEASEASKTSENPETEDDKTPLEGPKDPVEVELQAAPEGSTLAPAASKEEIEASIQEKLSRKTDKKGLDPFVPTSQVENEVKTIANERGFPLSRGTEIGARLMARSKRI